TAEPLVGLGAGEQDDGTVGEAELADITALGAHPAHEPDGVVAQLFQVSAGGVATGNLGRLAQRCRGLGHQRTFTVVGREAKPRTLTEWTRRAPSGSTS